MLFIESRERLAFGKTHELVLEILAAQGALALALCEALASQARPARLRPVNGPVGGRVIQVVHHFFDDSVFVDKSSSLYRRCHGAQGYWSDGALFNSMASLLIGARSGPSLYWNGHIDEVRVTKGVARYATDTKFQRPNCGLPAVMRPTRQS